MNIAVHKTADNTWWPRLTSVRPQITCAAPAAVRADAVTARKANTGGNTRWNTRRRTMSAPHAAQVTAPARSAANHADRER